MTHMIDSDGMIKMYSIEYSRFAIEVDSKYRSNSMENKSILLPRESLSIECC